MKNNYTLLTLFFLATTCWHSCSQEEVFLRATQRYHQRKFSDALSLYASIPIKNPAVWENMGNCAYYLEDYPHALVYWHKAQRNMCFKQYNILQARIQQAYSKLQIEDDERWYEKIQSFVAATMQRLPRSTWQIVFLLSWIFLMFVGPYLCRNKMYFRIGGLIGITFFCGILYAIQCRSDKQSFGIVLFSHASLHTGMDENLPVIVALKPGQKMKITDKEQGWYRGSVGLHTGWIHKDMLEVV